MAKKNIIEAGSVRAEAELNETETAALIWDALPIEASANTWGDEVYFDIPVSTGLENAVEVVEVGDLGYWPQTPDPRTASFWLAFDDTDLDACYFDPDVEERLTSCGPAIALGDAYRARHARRDEDHAAKISMDAEAYEAEEAWEERKAEEDDDDDEF